MSTEEPTSTPKPPAPKWGDPISAKRQSELKAMLDAWDAPDADHSERKGPFDGVRLIGADAFWLSERSGRGAPYPVPDLHLEGARLDGAHLEGADLTQAHLEGADLTQAHGEVYLLHKQA